MPYEISTTFTRLDGDTYTITRPMKTIKECENMIWLMSQPHIRMSYVNFTIRKVTTRYTKELFTFDNKTHIWQNSVSHTMGSWYNMH